MAEPKYVIATIKLPIEMLADGTFKTHADRADIGFLPCGSLPPINTELNSSAFDKLQELIRLDRGASRMSSIEINDSPMFVFKKIDSGASRSVSVGERLNSVAAAKEFESIAKINNEGCGRDEITEQRDADSVADDSEELPEQKQETEPAAIIDEVLKLFIKKDEINKKTSRCLNTSFKTRSKSSRSFSSKNRS